MFAHPIFARRIKITVMLPFIAPLPSAPAATAIDEGVAAAELGLAESRLGKTITRERVKSDFFHRTAATFVATAALLPLVAAARAPVPTYQVLDLGTLGGSNSSGFDINRAGQVTGYSKTANDVSHAFLYTDGAILDLGTLGGSESIGYAINDAGQVTGESESASRLHAFLYTDGVMADLGTVNGTYSSGRAINNAGQVTGNSTTDSTTPDGRVHAFLYTDATGIMKDLGTLGDSYSFGSGINDAGEVTGNYGKQFESHAFLYSHGRMIDLVPSAPSSFIEPYSKSINAAGHVTGSYRGGSGGFLYRNGTLIDLGSLGGGGSTGFAISDTTKVTGWAGTANGESHAFVYSTGKMKDLGTLPGGTYSIGYAINNAGDVTGQSNTATPGEYHAFVYRNGKMVDLGTLGGIEGSGTAINDAGQVTGWYAVFSFDDYELHSHAFLATPISLLFSRLLHKIKRIDHAQSLANTLRLAQRFYEVPNLQATCALLTVFVRGAAQSGKKKLDQEVADKLIADATAIQRALGCSQ
jgi:probable HAF family extracellular repeat protein